MYTPTRRYRCETIQPLCNTLRLCSQAERKSAQRVCGRALAAPQNGNLASKISILPEAGTKLLCIRPTILIGHTLCAQMRLPFCAHQVSQSCSRMISTVQHEHSKFSCVCRAAPSHLASWIYVPLPQQQLPECAPPCVLPTLHMCVTPWVWP